MFFELNFYKLKKSIKNQTEPNLTLKPKNGTEPNFSVHIGFIQKTTQTEPCAESTPRLPSDNAS